MGEIQNHPFQLSFNSSLRVDFQGSRVTSDGGLILVRELAERLSFGELIEEHLTDIRRGKNTQFPYADLLRQACPLLLAAPGREPSDSATVWEHGPADRRAALARRVDEPQTGAEFAGELGRERKSVGGIGWKSGSFGLWDSQAR